MKNAQLGSSSLSVSRVMLGAMARRRVTEDRFIEVVHAAIDAGVDTIDTAPLYDFGTSERWIGRAIRGRRDEVVLCTKVGLRWDGEYGEVLFPFTDEQGAPRFVRKDGRPESIRRDIDESLGRLGVEHIDLVQVHHPDPHVPIEDTMGALVEALEAGKVRAVGVSNFDERQVKAALAALHPHPLASLQLPYSLLFREVEDGLLPWARDAGVGFLCYSPLQAGALAGRFLDEAPPESWDPSLRPSNVALVNRVLRKVSVPIAARHDVSLSEVALAWLLAQPGVTSVIAGASTPSQVRASARAADLRLAPDEVEALGLAFQGLPLDLGPAKESLVRRGIRRLKRSLGKLPKLVRAR